MNNTFILSDDTILIKTIIEQINFDNKQIIPLSDLNFTAESEWHDFTSKLFKDNPSKLIIPISISTDMTSNTNGLIISMHIRLNYELPLSQRLVPIILLSDFNKNNILDKLNSEGKTPIQNYNLQSLFFTKGIYLSSFDIDEIKKTIEVASPCPNDEYKSNILNKIKIIPDENIRNHSIANSWGCFKLASVSGLGDEILNHPAISKKLKSMQAKYLISYNNAYTEEKRLDREPIVCNGKKILHIDDQSDEGWSKVMKNIFKSAGNDFVSIDSSEYKNKETGKFHNFDGFYEECQKQIEKNWDIIIIDLRLNPESEDIDDDMFNPCKFSGYRLLCEFLFENEGCQIIISTASNKIWYVNEALKRGATSYFIKESPEFNYSLKETNNYFQIFKNDVKDCFNKSYLRDLFKIIKDIKKENRVGSINFISECDVLLDTAWLLIKKENLGFGFFTLFQVVELYANEYYDYKDNFININDNPVAMINKMDNNSYELKLKYHFDQENGSYFTDEVEQKDEKPSVTTLFKISCALKFKFKQDNKLLKNFGRLNKIRNDIAHQGLTIRIESAVDEIKDILGIIQLISSPICSA